MSKDVDLVVDTAATAGVPLRLPAIQSLLADAWRAHGEDDMTAIIEPLDEPKGRALALRAKIVLLG